MEVYIQLILLIVFPALISFSYAPHLMSILPQHKSIFFRHPHHVHTSQPRFAVRVYSLVKMTPTRRSSIAAKEPQPPPPSPLPKVQRSIINDPDLRSTWSHRAWVASGCTSVLISLVKTMDTNTILEPVIAGLLGYVLADLGSGVYHWGIDNYGDASTPLFGSQIDAFQGHHKYPWTITRREFANNLHALARAITFFVIPLDLWINDPVMHAFIGVCSGCIMFSQQFHAWAHGTKSRLPPLVRGLQDAGVLVSRAQHADHHRSPYNNNYCIVSGIWNKFLDNQKVFEALELVLFFKLGVRPRSWSEPSSDWIEAADDRQYGH